MNTTGTSAKDNERYRAQIIEYGEGKRAINEMSVEDEGFWVNVVRAAARPGRSSDKAPFAGAAAEQLLRLQLSGPAAQARASVAVSLLEDAYPRVRRLAVGLVSRANIDVNQETLRRVVLGRDKEVAVEALHMVARKPTTSSYELLAEVLAHTGDYRATIASSELVRAGEAAIPALEKLLDSTDRSVRWRAVSTIVAIDGPASQQCLLRALHDDSVDIAWLAADGLLKLGAPAQVGVLKSVLSQRLTMATARALHHYAEHSSPRQTFKTIMDATQGLASLAAIPPAVESVLVKLEKPAT